jgi:hypothetical protein
MMGNNEQTLNSKVKKYIDHLFSDVEPSQQLFDLKEELTTNLKEKIEDYISRGMDEEQAFKEAVITIGDLSGLVEEMRKYRDSGLQQPVFSTWRERISTVGIVAGVLLSLFGIFTVVMLYYMKLPGEAVVGSGIFTVAGGALLTFSVLIRETRQSFGMNMIRAAIYGLSVGVLLFGLFSAAITRFSTGEMFISIGTLMVFTLIGVGVLLFLILTEKDRRKKVSSR